MSCCASKKVGEPTEASKNRQKTAKPETTAAFSERLPVLLGGSAGKPQEDEKVEPAKSKSSSLLPSFSGGSAEKPEDEVTGQADSSAASSSDSGGNMLGAVVKKILASYDERTLGVKVYTESMTLRPVTGSVEIRGLHVQNPEGYKSPYMLRANTVLLKVNMMKLMTSMGNTIDISEIDVDDVDAIYEKSFCTSNINDLMMKLEDGKTQQATDTGKASKKDEPKITLHTIKIRGIGAKACTNIWPGAGPRLAVADIAYEDFEKETGGAAGVMDVIALVTSTVLKSIMASIIGRGAMERILASCSCGQLQGARLCGGAFSPDAHEVTVS